MPNAGAENGFRFWWLENCFLMVQENSSLFFEHVQPINIKHVLGFGNRCSFVTTIMLEGSNYMYATHV